jgi:hypothetical protein
MHVKIEIPELKEYLRGFPEYWLNVTFMGNRPENNQVNAITTTYVRLVEGALTEYRQARLLVFSFWNEHRSLALGPATLSATYFEACLSDMHRATRFMICLRGHPDTPAGMRALIPKKPRFAEDRVADRIRNMRDAIQHLDEDLLEGRVSESMPFALIATGPETLIENEPGQTLKTIDRLAIGNLEIRFSELYKWLVEMGTYAEELSKFRRGS